MKVTSTCIILLGCIGYCMAFNPSASFDAISSIFKQMNRIKRDASNEESKCWSACNEAAGLDFQNETESMNLVVPEEPKEPVSTLQIVCYAHNPIWLEPACSVYEKYLQCLTKCPDELMKKLTLQLIKPAKFICKDRIYGIKKYLPCIFETCNKTAWRCESKCRPYEEALQQMPQEKHDATYSQKILHLENEFTYGCNYAGCASNCMLPRIERQCGPVAVNLERELIREIFSAVEEVLLTHVPDFEWPEACERFTSDPDHLDDLID